MRKKREDSGNKWGYGANASHAVGVYKDMILRVLVEERAAVRVRLMD